MDKSPADAGFLLTAAVPGLAVDVDPGAREPRRFGKLTVIHRQVGQSELIQSGEIDMIGEFFPCNSNDVIDPSAFASFLKYVVPVDQRCIKRRPGRW